MQIAISLFTLSKLSMKKYYAVRKGRETGIYESWTACERVVKGFSGAEYKSFKRREDALAYLEKESTVTAEEESFYPCAYIDGSYDIGTKRFSYGAVIMTAPGAEEYFSQSFEGSELAAMRNVAGEIKASEFAISYAIEKEWPTLTVYYDYFGIEKWATGEWKRNLPATQAYFAFCQDAFKKIKVKFVKVKGHSGNTFNDLADSLARKALNL